MKIKKQTGLYIVIGAFVVAIGSCFFIKNQTTPLPLPQGVKEIQPSEKTLESFDTSAAIQKALAGPTGQIIQPASKAEIEEIYKDITMIEIPHIFIDRLPDDWKIEKTADKTLFMKIVTALILRTNEQIVNERAALRLLQEKRLKNIPWNAEEKAFFEKMNEKYDTVLKRKESTKFAELLDKINIIPPSLAVAQAVMFTNWGQQNPKALYGEYGWRGEEAYEPIQFDSLTQATDSFALQLNSRSQLIGFREIRRYVIPMERTRYIGVDLLAHIDKYMEWDKSYIDKLINAYRRGQIKELDWACFKGTCQMPADDSDLELE